MTVLPTWAVYLVSLGTPVLTFIGVLVAGAVNRKGAVELETRSKREETMRVLRWAAELAISDDEARSRLGVSELNALADSDLLDREQELFVSTALSAVVDDPADVIEESGPDTEVFWRRWPTMVRSYISPVPSSDRGTKGMLAWRRR